jgi:hypothetical protein
MNNLFEIVGIVILNRLPQNFKRAPETGDGARKTGTILAQGKRQREKGKSEERGPASARYDHSRLSFVQMVSSSSFLLT